MRKAILSGAVALSTLSATAASASVTVGGFTFDNNAFVDTLLSSSGSFTVSGGTLSSVLTDTNVATYAFPSSEGASLTLGFTDNVAVNGAGNDIVLFELGTPDTWNVLINGVTHSYTSSATGESAGGFSLNAAALDLSDFGIGAGASITSLRLSFVTSNSGTVASTSLVGALNSGPVGVPEPATWATMLFGFGGLGAALRRRRALALTTAPSAA